MTHFPEALYYDRKHGWVAVEGRIATQGLTELGQRLAGKIAFIEIPRPGRTVSQGQTLLSMESGKWVGRLPAGVSGVILASNQELEEEPGLVNDSPYEAGWLVKIEMSDPGELANLMKPAMPEFTQFIEEEEKKYAGFGRR
jgi:glycine cleavage system H protein